MRLAILGLLAAVCSCAQESHPLLHTRRIFVGQLSGGISAIQIRDMIINALQATKLFIITENAERADATLRGSAEDLVFTDKFDSSDSINARASLGGANAISRRPSVSIGEHEATHTAERKHEAVAAVRLVGKEGDVIWSTTQESLGAKFRGASADVADKVTKQLLADIAAAKTSVK
ncbi:MAG TPA: hypothetical protein VMZ52_10450 [Bryobacteraceae bacterium]|nr:hypothetical protein [Bryobacteraceae bacterium]